MFSGITQGVARIVAIAEGDGSRRLTIAFPDGFCAGLQQGASVAIDGACLTVAAPPEGDLAQFDLILPTLVTSTLAGCQVGDRINAERALRDGAEIGGHALSGHVDYQATVEQLREYGDNLCLRLAVPAGALRYLFAKGYVAVNGVSLTIAGIDKPAGWIEVWLIPETRRATVLADKGPGSRLNLEIERQTQVLVDTMREALEEKLSALLPLLARPGKPAALPAG
ncbi:riboflavin synthase subunit alpha [Chromobacterium sphagni]|uniref:Riboflavin synthase subunit alpha n=1 Tax=Chromobacterium sphagni TaxID=1903179 RepID=A0A1S1X2I1_9NEIS|nr:riboflavin synthase subunit alpha [Chromobacterium sphagni]OHX13649.1 riboflavin synthase subunit alpha [Chromobacterium sphagni]OHX18026.1 riboflavin synthase subunit alpha [Chromobacterium sphagni]